jgi:CheY-like chemotaxis protein/anti-sigma regulatory factor (Ser/Thr protein kinase)
MVQPLFDLRAAPLKLQLPAQPLYVSGDPVRLAQVVQNLLSNAAKFTPSDGRIALSAEVDGDQARITVEDSGAGLSADLLPRVFELFVQGQQALDRQAGGLGLGLAIVRTLVELHGGRVAAESEGEGKGSRFTVWLPRATGGVAASAAGGTGTAAAPVARRVLVVDDNRDAAETLAMVLETFGHQVRKAHDGPQGLSLLQEFQPELAVLDIGLPGMDGYELARRLRSHPLVPGVRLVAVTGYGHALDRAKAMAAGFDEHFVKPVEAETLAAAIDRLTAARRG